MPLTLSRYRAALTAASQQQPCNLCTACHIAYMRDTKSLTWHSAMQAAGRLAEGGIDNLQIGSQYAKQVHATASLLEFAVWWSIALTR